MRCLELLPPHTASAMSGFRIGVDTQDAGFQDASHFARVFRKLEGTASSRFQADHVSVVKP